MRYIVLFFIGVLASSCTSSKGLYYWGNYETSYYNKVHKPGDESNQAHIKELKKIINKTERKSKLRIGPGIYGEYGYYLLQGGQPDMANDYFIKEKQLFPESTTTINFISK